MNELATGTTVSGSDEFIELLNPGAGPVDLSGWRIVYRSAAGTAEFTLARFPAGAVLGPGGYYVVAGDAFSGPAQVAFGPGTGLAAAGGGVGLRDPLGVLVDSVGWGSAANALVEGVPAPAPPTLAPPGDSIARMPNGTDTGDNARDFGLASPAAFRRPTPGAPNTDVTPPVLAVPAEIVAEATGPAGAAVRFEATASDDLDGALTPACAPPPGSSFPLGATEVTCAAADAAGNGAAATFPVRVVDTTPPVLAVPDGVVVEATGPAGGHADYPGATATDLVDGPVEASCAPAPGLFPLGTTGVSCAARDARGNEADGSFLVRVLDTTPPVVTVEADPAGSSFAARAVDLVDGSVLPACSPAAGAALPPGTVVVTCSAVDAHGNAVTSSFAVRILAADEVGCTVVGTPGGDVLRGTAGPDVVCGLGGDDRILGEGGADIIRGGAGNDVLLGGPGDDTIEGGDGGNVLFGGPGDDTLLGGPDYDSLTGDAGSDLLRGGGGGDSLDGGQGTDRLDGGDGADKAVYSSSPAGVTVDLAVGAASGGFGADALDGIESVVGSRFPDALSGDGGPNVLLGGPGDDSLAGGGGADSLSGEAGADRIDGGPGDDVLAGGEGADLLEGSGGANLLYGGPGNDRLMGGPAYDSLSGEGGDDALDGAGGGDSLSGGPGADSLAGGSGPELDHVWYGAAPAGVAVDLARGRASGGEGDDALQGIERVTGSRFADVLLLRDGVAGGAACGGGADSVEADPADAVATDCELVARG